MSIAPNNVELGSFLIADAPEIMSWQNNVEDKRILMGFRFPVSEQTSIDWLKKRLDPLSRFPTEIYWAIRTLQESKLLGFVTLYNIDYINRNAEMGIYLGGERKQGIGSFVIEECLELGYKDLNLRKIQVSILETNSAALRAFRSAGFEGEGKFLDQYWDGFNWRCIEKLAHFKRE